MVIGDCETVVGDRRCGCVVSLMLIGGSGATTHHSEDRAAIRQRGEGLGIGADTIEPGEEGHPVRNESGKLAQN